MLITFIQNITLLISAVVVYTMIIGRWEKGSLYYSLFSGLLFGVSAILGMLMPLVLEPGVIFDGRSIILSVAGLFGGPLTALIAAVTSSAYRAYIGGPGMLVGIATIILSSSIGAAYFSLNRGRRNLLTPLHLIVFSLLVNIPMLYLFTYIPGLTTTTVLTQLAPPILVTYPLATLTIAYIINAQEAKLNTEKNLRESEMRLQKTQEIANIGSWELNLISNTLTCSPEVNRIIGTGSEQFTISYDTFMDMIHPEDRATVDRTYRESFKSDQNSFEVEHRVVRLDNGEIRYVYQRYEHIRSNSGRAIRTVGMIQDITERKLYEKRLQYISLHDQLTGLYNRTYFEEEMQRLSKSREYPISILSADLDGLKLINDTLGHIKGDEMLIRCTEALVGSLRTSDILARIGGDEFAAILPKTDSAEGEAIHARIKADIEAYNQGSADLPLSISIGLATANSAEEGALLGALKTADYFMYKEKLYRRGSSRDQIVSALMVALAERDFIAEGHADRVKILCNEMGLKAGLSATQLADLTLLAQVHDLGKVGIPDHILFKPGPLTDEEWEIMKMHPEKGYRIASASSDLAVVADLILKHHEHWNGQGYPQGLEKEDIPIECRILSIVDAYDAMINKRPYNKVKTKAEALTELQRCAGSQFDPKLIEIFMTIAENYE